MALYCDFLIWTIKGTKVKVDIFVQFKRLKQIIVRRMKEYRAFILMYSLAVVFVKRTLTSNQRNDELKDFWMEFGGRSLSGLVFLCMITVQWSEMSKAVQQHVFKANCCYLD